MMRAIWLDLKNNMNIIFQRFTIDNYYKITFRRIVTNLKFHQFLCEENNIKFKKFLRIPALDIEYPAENNNRVEHLVSMLE